jgi:hypothetical protein
MMKAKLAVFLAAATLSLSASAGFVQYDFSDATFSDGGSLSGFFVQNTDDKAIAYMSMNVAGGAPHMHGAQFLLSGWMSNIISASTYFAGAGPTNFSAYNDQDEMYYRLDLDFASTSTAGMYRVFGENVQFPRTWNDAMGWTPGSRTLVSGFAVEGTIDPFLLAFVENGPVDGINYIVPELVSAPMRVPEPGSLALLMLGVAGLFGMRRRSKIAESV